MAYRLGVDVGGTFTDLFLVDDDRARQWRVKTPSTPRDPSDGVLTGVERICAEAGIAPGDLRNLVHGTTVATNAVLESKGARVGLVTTRGFGQILHLARSQTPGPLAGWIIMLKPDPPASLADTREAVERMDAAGQTVVPVDREQVAGVIEDLIASGVESLTISLINSYVDGRHEQEIAAIVEERHPGFPVTISSDVLPEFREYERTLTACMNSYVRPTVADYVGHLETRLRDLGTGGELNILRSDAGVMTPREAARNPVYGVLSGPSGGVAGALHVAARAGFPNILTFDMGGTSTDVSLCRDGEPTIGRETTIGQFKIKVPSVDVHTVGAGGGSIAHVPELTKALRVGPESAGADPGPAAYGRGGEAPTVTDANVVVGHLPPRLIGGEMALDVGKATAAVQTIADATGLSLDAAAEGILAITNETMAGALRLVSVQRGHDPRELALVAFGGAGPLHANAVAALMGSFPVIVPPSPGLLCALGDLVADYRSEFARTLIRLVSDATPEEVLAVLDELDGRARTWMADEGIATERQTVTFVADMRYHGQGYEIPVPLAVEEIRGGGGLGELEERFNGLHDQLYGFRMPNTASEIVNLRAVATGDLPKPELPEAEVEGEDAGGAIVEQGEILFAGERRPTPIYDRAVLRPGNRFAGPAIVTEFDSTTVVLPGYVAEVDRFSNILITPEDAS
jgi:N-methylhydantoinase A